ncbi:hypothetical protein RHCRD62_20691 [Rhodococcus sp. RD6.2]|nr:hypothetical protein RHCRD62_20691 [Rhodococcus sp. RD6.2]
MGAEPGQAELFAVPDPVEHLVFDIRSIPPDPAAIEPATAIIAGSWEATIG